MEKPNLIEVFSPSGESSGWELRHPDTNELLWTDNLYGVSEEAIISRARRLGGKVIIIGTGRPFPAFKEYPLSSEEAFTPVPFEERTLSIREIVDRQKKILLQCKR